LSIVAAMLFLLASGLSKPRIVTRVGDWGAVNSRPRFKPWFRCEIIPSEGVILLSDRGHSLLPGNLYLGVASLLDGQHTVDEIVGCLEGELPAAHVYYAVELLRRRGYLTDADSSLPPEQAAFWDTAGIDGDVAARFLQETAVSVRPFGKIDAAPLTALLTSLGIRIDDDGDRQIVLTDDYLRDELRAVNQEALENNRSWLLTKPVGSELWLGPLFIPEKTGCWTCLAHRLQGARKVESYLQTVRKTSDPFPVLPAALPSTVHAAFSIAATEIAKWIACGRNECLEGQIVTLNTFSLATQNHVLVRRPQCPSCGNPEAFAAGQSAPVVLHTRKKVFTDDGGHRGFSPQDTLRKLENHISPVTGIVSNLYPTSSWAGEDSLVPSYVTVHNFVEIFSGESSGVDFLQSILQPSVAGKGKSPVQAKASALCESIERYSGVFQADEARLQARFSDLGDAAIHVNDCMLFSERQFKNRKQWNALGSTSSWVPLPLDVNAEIEWSPVWSLTSNVRRYLPTAYCYYGYSQKHSTWFARADSNGCAAGHSKEEAILQGFMELVERDSVALWWYNRLRKPAIDLASFAEPYFHKLQTYYQTLHRDLWVLDITGDLNIPSFAAISRRNDKATEDIILGFGAHFDSRIAILRALTEVNQLLAAVSSTFDNDEEYFDDDPAVISWWKTATLENQPYLAPDKTSIPKVQGDYAKRWSDDFLDDVMTCVRIAKEKGLETLVLDQTRPDTGLHVVKVFVPGLRHFWPRFAPGRLYDVPVSMGWLAAPLTEDQLNTLPIYF
jgi:bacteriocin biosynthesis cyclodehydratase domain-containing protein